MIIVMTETEQPTSPLIQVTGVKWIMLMMWAQLHAPRDPGCKVSPAIGDFRHSQREPPCLEYNNSLFNQSSMKARSQLGDEDTGSCPRTLLRQLSRELNALLGDFLGLCITGAFSVDAHCLKVLGASQNITLLIKRFSLWAHHCCGQ